jgi:hypothetical protein
VTQHNASATYCSFFIYFLPCWLVVHEQPLPGL